MDSLAGSHGLTEDLMHVSFDSWTQRREIASLGTNAGASRLPFQSWHHFKEAFAPELVARAFAESKRSVERCGDPFGGSGTTALACQFLGVEPVTIEVNPYLADLIEAKLHPYDTDKLVRSLGTVIKSAYNAGSNLRRFKNVPSTFIESDDKPRWVFDKHVARRISSYLDAIESIADPSQRRFFKVQLGGMLVQVSNIVVNGKGRRYRRGWENRSVAVRQVDELFAERCERAIVELHEHRFRKSTSYSVLRGDCRQAIEAMGTYDIAVFSPPYPNSFDYTDVYNVELWMLGYLCGASANRDLRNSTLCSHVQIKRDYPAKPVGSKRLDYAVRSLQASRACLWNAWIPEMVGGYFSDMSDVLRGVRKQLCGGGEVWAVVGDSRYANVHVPTAAIIADLAPALGFDVVGVESFRSMRVSAQQGGREELDESLLVLRKRNEVK